MNNHNTLAVKTDGLGKSFGKVDAVRSLDLRVPKNSIFAFLGPNGAGKTTTIKMLLGLSKPTEGSGTVFGLDIVNDSTEVRRKVGYLAQDPRYYPRMTVFDTLRFTAGFFYAGPKNAIESRIKETLDLVGMRSKADRLVQSLSGGERQRLGIAQAQINYPDLLILDEPAASLDPMGRKDVLDVMERLRKHTTILYSTHILSDVQRVSDTVAIMDNGRLVTQAPIEELLADKGTTAYQVRLLAGPDNLAGLREGLSKLAWINGISEVDRAGGEEVWSIDVSDEDAARSLLLREILTDKEITVLEFVRKKRALEDVFIQMVGGGQRE